MRADKRFGQHFLVSEKVVRAIVGQVTGCASALEVGPGPGVLTGPLCASLGRVCAVEVDETVLPPLREAAPDAEVIVGDALHLDLRAVLEGLPRPRALVSNMPYNITGPLLTAFAACRDSWDVGVLMMQREVGVRVMAPAGDSSRGSLSVFLQAQFDITTVCHAPPGAFLPPPKVDSIVLRFVPRLKVDLDRAPTFFEVVRRGFAHPRKTLTNNLGDRAAWAPVLASVGLAETVRPHQLTLAQWEELAAHGPR